MSETVLYDHPGPRARRRAQLGTVLGGLVVVGLLGLVLYRLADRGQFDGEKWESFADPVIWEFVFEGLRNTLKAAIVAIVLAIVFGMLLAAGRLSERPLVRAAATTVVEFFRAVPVLMLMLFFFLGWPETFGAYGSVVLALMLYNGAVLAEIFRAGIQAVPRGQAEAAYSLGLRKSQVMSLVLVPQAVRTMLPAIISQCVVALKDTSLGYVITYEELVRTGRQIYISEFNIIPTTIVIASIYIAINMSLSWLAHWLERRQRRSYGKAVLSADLDTGAAT
jgi:glutamate transport system permease protein